MIVKKSGASPDQRRKYDEAHKAEALRLASESRSTQAAARQLGSRPKLLYRWQQAQLVAEVGSVEVARAPEVRQLRAMPGATARGACGPKATSSAATRCAPGCTGMAYGP